MTIEILPAQLANQIAAGEVVERPASVIKELIENSLDACATTISVDIEKGGIKKIRISDNGKGIAKNELKLALSRHATSKIKNLADLESIGSLGFRGEALASISSVARLTLTSKPIEQETAWQAHAEGRDMTVTIQPAAHSNGTTIEVKDLFFNTPARRKFLRTEKTEFAHIDEVIRRIALANFSVSFTLTHNGKIVRQYREAQTKAQKNKRVAMICGHKFIEHAVEIDCHHDNMILTGWLATPQFYRNQNDLSYCYVNGRMMRDKLLNHAIRQAYANLLPADTFPAFVLFFQLDNREVDVNVHPAKHEVRFHQSRYVHDFIFSVCQKSLEEQSLIFSEDALSLPENTEQTTTPVIFSVSENIVISPKSDVETSRESEYQRPSYVQPLQQISDVAKTSFNAYRPSNTGISSVAVKNYQQLMTPLETVSADEISVSKDDKSDVSPVSYVKAPGFAVITIEGHLRVLSLFKLAEQINALKVDKSWQQGMISQPLLLPISLLLSDEQFDFVEQHQGLIKESGIVLQLQSNKKIQVRQFPAMLRSKNVNECLLKIIDTLKEKSLLLALNKDHFIQAISQAMVNKEYNKDQAVELLLLAKSIFSKNFIQQIYLNSVALDLTSEIKLLNS